MNKKLVAGLAVAGMFVLGIAGNVHASIIENVTLSFASGATWEGTITFNDGYQGMTDASGTLNGGTNNWDNVDFDWTFLTKIGKTNPRDKNTDGYYDDWLGTVINGKVLTIGLSWSATTSTASDGIVFALLPNSYYSGIYATNDLLSGYSVPEPSTMLLLGSGLLGLVGLNRRRNA